MPSRALLRVLPLGVVGIVGAMLGGCAAPAEEGDDVLAAASEALTSYDGLLARAGGSTHSSVTRMGRHYERFAAQVLTGTQRAFLADASMSPAVPPSVANLRLERFPVNLFPSGDPTPADVNQHAVGDCSAASVFASLALLAPAFVRGLVDDHHDGTFGVRMFDPAGRRIVVNVDARFLARSATTLEAMSGKDGGADWATVLEKAAMKYLAVFPITGPVGRIGGIGSELASPMFTGTGESVAFPPGSLTPAELTQVVRGALARGKIVIGGFNTVMPVETLKTVTLHAYAILLPGAPGAMVSVRNPWGASPRVSGGYDGSRDGVLDIPALSTWSLAMDLRIIDAGAATGAGITLPYTPPGPLASDLPVRVSAD